MFQYLLITILFNNVLILEQSFLNNVSNLTQNNTFYNVSILTKTTLFKMCQYLLKTILIENTSKHQTMSQLRNSTEKYLNQSLEKISGNGAKKIDRFLSRLRGRVRHAQENRAEEGRR
jgi:hypothetical protein